MNVRDLDSHTHPDIRDVLINLERDMSFRGMSLPKGNIEFEYVEGTDPAVYEVSFRVKVAN